MEHLLTRVTSHSLKWVFQQRWELWHFIPKLLRLKHLYLWIMSVLSSKQRVTRTTFGPWNRLPVLGSHIIASVTYFLRCLLIPCLFPHLTTHQPPCDRNKIDFHTNQPRSRILSFDEKRVKKVFVELTKLLCSELLWKWRGQSKYWNLNKTRNLNWHARLFCYYLLTQH